MHQYVVQRAAPAVVARPLQDGFEARAAGRPAVAATGPETKSAASSPGSMPLAQAKAALINPPVATGMPSGQRPFSAARELLAQRSKPRKPGHRRKKALTSIPGARLEHLMCFIDNNRLQNDLGTLTDLNDQQFWELSDVNRSRGEEVARLALDASSLKELMREPDDALLYGCGCCGSIKSSSSDATIDENRKLQKILDSRRLLIDELERQVENQSEDLNKARQRAEVAHKDAAMEEARLKVLMETHEQEVSELRRHLALEQPSHGAAFGLSLAERQVDGSACSRLVLAERLRMEEAQKLLEIERRLHSEEVEAIWRDVQATSRVADAIRGQTDSVRSAEGRRKLLLCCEELHRPVCDFLRMLGRPPLPEVPAGTDELGAWLELLNSCLCMCDEMVNGRP